MWKHKASGQEVASMGGFPVLYADPNWKYRNDGRGAATNHYRTLSLGELAQMPVQQLAADDAVLFMWAVWPMLPDAFGLMRAWGFEYYNCGLLWVKTNTVATNTPFVGLGHMTRGNSEPCLLGVRGKPKRVDKAVQQIIYEGEELIVSPVGEHSAKPAEARARITRLMGEDLPAIEMFARQPAPGWESFGDELESTISLEYRP